MEHALAALLEATAADGGCAVVSEQAGWRLRRAVSGWLQLDDGGLDGCGAPGAPSFPAPAEPTGAVVLAASDLAVERGGRRRGISITATPTLEACGHQLLALPGVRLSLATIAIADS